MEFNWKILLRSFLIIAPIMLGLLLCILAFACKTIFGVFVFFVGLTIVVTWTVALLSTVDDL